MLSNLGNWGMAAEDGPWLVAVPCCWDQCFIPHGIGAGLTEEGVCCWLTHLKQALRGRTHLSTHLARNASRTSMLRLTSRLPDPALSMSRDRKSTRLNSSH